MPTIVEFETVAQLFLNLFMHYDGQNRTAVRYKDKQTKEWIDITYEQLRRQVESMAGFLHKRGIRPGDRVAVLSENRPEWAVSDIATQFIGGVNVSLYTSLPPSQVAYILKDSGSRILIVSTAIQLKKAEQALEQCPGLELIVTMSEMRREHPHVISWDAAMQEGEQYWKENRKLLTPLAIDVKPEDLSALIYTSGTTGNPKGVMLTHDNFCFNVKSVLDFIWFEATDHHLSFLPLCHSFERTAGYLAVMSCGATVSYAESIDTVSRNLEEVRPTVMISVPRLFEKVYNLIAKSVEEGSPIKKRIFAWSVDIGKKYADANKSGKAVSPFLRVQQNLAHQLVFSKLLQKLGGNLRFAVSGGAALPKQIGEFFEAAGVNIVEGYGLTETAPVLAVNPLENPRYGSVGYVIPGVTIGIQRLSDRKIVARLSGKDYPSNLTSEEGEIVVKGRNVMKGYWNNEADTKSAIDKDGWYHTGDVGRFVDGYLTITDRIKHMIVSAGGKNIYPAPIEDLFKSVTWIDQILVIGEGREYLTALVVPSLDAVKHYAGQQGIAYSTDDELLQNAQVKALYEAEFASYSRNAAAHEKIRDFRLLPEAFTIENEMMTPSLKLRRREIEKHYAELIESMYGQFA